MARQINRLSARGVQALKVPGMHADGAGLYLRVTKTGAKHWVFVFHWSGRRREMGLGGLLAVSLARAREKAADARAQVADGIDPVAARQRCKSLPTFGYVADEFIRNRTASVRSEKSVARIVRCVGPGGYADSLRSKRVDQVDVEDVLRILRPIWTTKPATGAMVRGYLENVLDAAKAKRLRSGDNPARWKGHLDHLLPERKRLTRGHFAAIPYAEMPKFIARLKSRDALAARGLEFLILTAARSGEVLGACWDEIDFDRKLWVVPGNRMKSGREHRVPLSDAAVDLLERLRNASEGPAEPRGGYVLPGRKLGKPLSGMAFEMVLRRMGVDGITIHGMRSAFRDWVGEETHFPREVAEAALAHTVGDQAELAYRRGDALAKRRELMEAWAGYCLGSVGEEANPAIYVKGDALSLGA